MLVPLFGAANFGKSANVSAQRRINMYTEVLRDQDKASTVLYGRPGLSALTITQHTVSAAPVMTGIIKGLQQVRPTSGGNAGLDEIIAAIGNTVGILTNSGNLYQVQNTADTTVNPVGLGTFNGSVVMADNGVHVLMVTGAAGFILSYNSASPTYTQIADTDFPQTATSACFIASRFVVNDPSNPGRFRWSNLLDGTTWDALDFATAESSPDPLTGVFESNGELLLFGSQTLEFWAPTTDTSVFARIGGSASQWGTTAWDTVRKLGTGVAFLGRNRGGDRQVVLVNGYVPQVISDSDIEARINADAAPDGATAVSFTVQGHQFYCLNLTNTSLVYDLTTGMWHEFQSEGSRFAANFGAAAFGEYILSDYAGFRLFTLDANAYTDYGAVLTRELTSRHVFADAERVTCNRLFMDMETGVGLSDSSAQGYDPQVMLQVSKDGGHTFGNELWTSMGKLGQYLTRAVWRRLGIGRDWVFKFRVTDPVKVVFLYAGVDIK